MYGSICQCVASWRWFYQMYGSICQCVASSRWCFKLEQTLSQSKLVGFSSCVASLRRCVCILFASWSLLVRKDVSVSFDNSTVFSCAFFWILIVCVGTAIASAILEMCKL